MLLPSEQAVLGASAINRDTVDALSALLANRWVTVAKVTSPLDLGANGGTLISWTATNGVLVRGTMIRAVLFGSCTVDTNESFNLRCTPTDASGGNYAVSARTDFAPGVLATFAWQIEAWWRLSGDPGSTSPTKAAVLNLNASQRLMLSTDTANSDSFGGGAAGIPPVLCNVATRFTAGHDVYTGSPQTFSVFFQPRLGNTTDLICNGGWMEVL